MTDFNIYPNPGKDVLNVRLHTDRGEAYTVVLRNLTGQVVHSKQHNGSGHDENIRINIENLPEGCYIIDLNTASKGSVYHKFIVVK
ncbi:MAG: T9SS type A sorting domain-containing protein [Lentimicrobiaceae bacterium]|nr:T9SS type A sorting domain-containing protein [Lentimicrobiaceae bacterium]